MEVKILGFKAYDFTNSQGEHIQGVSVYVCYPEDGTTGEVATKITISNPELWQHRIAMGIASVIHVFNPPCVVLGGGLMEDQERFFNLCREIYTLLAPGFEHLTIASAELKNRAGMLGAGYLAMKKLAEKGYSQL